MEDLANYVLELALDYNTKIEDRQLKIYQAFLEECCADIVKLENEKNELVKLLTDLRLEHETLKKQYNNLSKAFYKDFKRHVAFRDKKSNMCKNCKKQLNKTMSNDRKEN